MEQEMVEFEGEVTSFKRNKTSAEFKVTVEIPEMFGHQAFALANWRKRSIKFTCTPTTEPLGEHAD